MSRSRHIGVVFSGLLVVMACYGCIFVQAPSGATVDVRLLNKSQAQVQSKEKTEITTEGAPSPAVTGQGDTK